MPTPIRFLVKQHTPILHFLHDQKGATLRATELKPKLDRYLWEKVFRRRLTPETLAFHKRYDPEGHRVKGDAYLRDYVPTFDYRVQIFSPVVEPIPKREFETRFGSLFFGNINKNHPHEMKLAVFCEDLIEISFDSWHSGLQSSIAAAFPAFLATTNFGTRQTKGYGSFFIDESDPNYVAFLEILQLERDFFLYSNYDYSQESNLLIRSSHSLKDVENIYKLMKSGNSFPGAARAGLDISKLGSYLNRYFQETVGRDFFSEKHQIRLAYYGDDSKFGKSRNPQFLFHRATLGLPPKFEFERGEVSISTNHDVIKRYRSPITFKFVDATLVILAEDTFDDIEGEMFSFTVEKGDSVAIPNIPVPTTFDIEAFLRGFVPYFNSRKRTVSDRVLNARLNREIQSQSVREFLITILDSELFAYERNIP